MRGSCEWRKAVGVLVCLFFVAPGLSRAEEEFCRREVRTTEGRVRGELDAEVEACVWWGIPYAAAPVGEKRFRRPGPPPGREGVYEALQPGPVCVQEESALSGGVSGRVGEDCLSLNIWAPARSGVFPVMFWIHGGGFIAGAGSYDLYNGARLAAEAEVVVVTVNYRLGALGFLALPELAAEDPEGSTGNYGLLDQIRALNWVRDNIAAFGGDPENVTIFGQSAGAMSVCALLTSPAAAGLFHRAFMMSGPCQLMSSLEEAYEKSRRLAAKLGCEGPQAVECLRAKPAGLFKPGGHNDLFAGGVAWAPVVDGRVLPGKPLERIAAGEYQRVPLMIGTTRDELRIYTINIPGLGLWSRAAVTSLLRLITGDRFPEIIRLYSYEDYRRPIDLAFAFGNDLAFNTPAFQLAEAVSREGPVYLYRFDWHYTRFPHKLGAFHALDIPFVFGALEPDLALAKLLANKKMYEENEPLVRQVGAYVTNFARTGNPNTEDLPLWPSYDPTGRARLIIDRELFLQPVSEKEAARFEYYTGHEITEFLKGALSRLMKRE